MYDRNSSNALVIQCLKVPIYGYPSFKEQLMKEQRIIAFRDFLALFFRHRAKRISHAIIRARLLRFVIVAAFKSRN